MPVSEADPSLRAAGTVARLREAFDAGHTRPIAWRVAQLAALERMMAENEEAIRAALRSDLGKPVAEAMTAEIDFIRKEAKLARTRVARWARPRIVSTPLAMQPGRSSVAPSPYGVALIIGAWNYPFQLTLAPLVGAIAAGNCALLKPSELAPASAALMAELVGRYLDPEAIVVVEGGATVAAALLEQRFDIIFYTGGERVGRIVMTAAAAHLCPVVLELGGKNPCIVDETADLAVAARRIAWGRFLNAGQICVAPDHILVAASAEQALIQHLGQALTEFFGPDPKSSPDFGRIVNDAHFDRLSRMLGDGDVIIGGQTDRASCYIAPTILANVASNSPAMTEEIFGPILPVVAYRDLDETLAQIRSRPAPLALYAFTGNRAVADHIIASTQSGTVAVNDTVVFMANPELPFGGVGASGMGSCHGKYSFDAFSRPRAILKRSFALDSSLRYPPFDARKLAWLRRFA